MKISEGAFMKLACIGVAALAAVASTSARADVPFYFGASGSLATADNFSAASFNEDLSFDAARTSETKETTGYKVTAGLLLAPWVALEGGYLDFGKPSFSSVSNGPPCCISAYYATGPVSGSVASHGLDLALILQWPLPNDITIGARGGLLKWSTKAEVRDSAGPRNTQSQDGQDFFYGLDIRIPVIGKVALALDYDVFKLSTEGSKNPPPRLNHYELSTLSLGFIVPFGNSPAH